MDAALPGKVGRFGIGHAKTKDIGVANGFGAKPCSQNIPKHPQAGVGPTVGFDGRGAVVGLHLETEVIVFIKANNAGIVREHADTPIACA